MHNLSGGGTVQKGEIGRGSAERRMDEERSPEG